MTTTIRTLFTALLVGFVLALSGCAMPRMIDSDVQSFTAAVPAVRPALYRFERLPSQGDAASQDQIEALAIQALAKVGLTPAPLVQGAVAGTAGAAPTARYAAQVSVQITGIVSPYQQTSVGGFWGHGGWRHGGGGFGIGMGLMLEPTWYRHAVRIVLRDSTSGQLAYETSASFDGPWMDSGNLLPVVLDAALNGYPKPPSGPRKVVIELPGAAPPAPAQPMAP
jgi:hypothetical protein